MCGGGGTNFGADASLSGDTGCGGHSPGGGGEGVIIGGMLDSFLVPSGLKSLAVGGLPGGGFMVGGKGKLPPGGAGGNHGWAVRSSGRLGNVVIPNVVSMGGARVAF